MDTFKVYDDSAPFMDFSQSEYDSLAQSNLSYIRTHAIVKTSWGLTMEMLTNPPGITGAQGGMRALSQHTLASLLNIINKAKSSPWLQIEMYMSESEWLGFAEYLFAPYDPQVDSQSTKPWAFKRFMQGRVAPWIDAFAKLLLELSNETWNALFQPWLFFGTSTTDVLTGRVYNSGEVYGLFQVRGRCLVSFFR
jgi:hypothetical protein